MENVLSTGAYEWNDTNTSLVGEDAVSRHGGVMQFLLEFAPFVVLCDRYFSIVLLVIGIPGNILSFLVWTNRKVRRENSSAIYLGALSMNDLLLLSLVIVNDLKYAWGVDLVNVQVICQIFIVSFLTLQYLSSLLVLTFSAERWIAICYPFYRDKLCTPQRAIAVVAGMCLFSLAICLVQAYFWKAQSNGCSLVVEEKDAALHRYYTFIVEILISGGVPVLTLTFNVIVICELHRITYKSSAAFLHKSDDVRTTSSSVIMPEPVPSVDHLSSPIAMVRSNTLNISTLSIASHAARETLLTPPSTNKRQRTHLSHTFRSTTIMLLTVSFYLIFTTLPAGLVYALQSTTVVPDQYMYMTDGEIGTNHTWQMFFLMRKVKSVIDEIALSHIAFNFLIYCMTGRLFRQQLLQLLRMRHGYSRQRTMSHARLELQSVNRSLHPRSSIYPFASGVEDAIHFDNNLRCRGVSEPSPRLQRHRLNRRLTVKPNALSLSINGIC